MIVSGGRGRNAPPRLATPYPVATPTTCPECLDPDGKDPVAEMCSSCTKYYACPKEREKRGAGAVELTTPQRMQVLSLKAAKRRMKREARKREVIENRRNRFRSRREQELRDQARSLVVPS